MACVISVARTEGKELYASVSTSHIIDFLRYLSRERRRRRALIHGLQEEGEPCGRAQRIHLHHGCNLKILTPPPPPPPLSLTALRPVRQGGSGQEGAKAGEHQRRSPLDGLIQLPIASKLETCLSAHEDETAASPGGILVRGAR